MNDRPDFHELVGEDLPPEERSRLERVHDLLVAAGPPPELPPALAAPDVERADTSVSFLPRRRAGLALGLAAAIGLVAFLGGFITGRAKEPFAETFHVAMKGTSAAPAANAVIKVGKSDESGNWPLKVVLHGLPRPGKQTYYEMFLTRGHRPVATCGTFSVRGTSTTVRLNAPYNLRRYDGWVVLRERFGDRGRGETVLTT